MLTPKTPSDSDVKTIGDYVDLIETVAKVECVRLSSSSHLIEYSEIVNIAAMAVHIIITSHKGKEFNISYLSTAIKWAIRNELRRRYRWYSLSHQITDEQAREIDNLNKINIREAIYETILSINDLSEAENPKQIKDSSSTPDENLELKELSKAIKKTISKLPNKERIILEKRFYKGEKVKDISKDLKISPSRVSRIIQTGLDKVKNALLKQELV